MNAFAQKLVSLTAIALGMSSGTIADKVQTARETTITARWVCDAPRKLATDASATVRECHWDVK